MSKSYNSFLSTSKVAINKSSTFAKFAASFYHVGAKYLDSLDLGEWKLTKTSFFVSFTIYLKFLPTTIVSGPLFSTGS